MSEESIIYEMPDGIIRFTQKEDEIVGIDSYTVYEDGTVSYGYADIHISGFVMPDTSDAALEVFERYSNYGSSIREYPSDMDSMLESDWALSAYHELANIYGNGFE